MIDRSIEHSIVRSDVSKSFRPQKDSGFSLRMCLYTWPRTCLHSCPHTCLCAWSHTRVHAHLHTAPPTLSGCGLTSCAYHSLSDLADVVIVETCRRVLVASTRMIIKQQLAAATRPHYKLTFSWPARNFHIPGNSASQQ